MTSSTDRPPARAGGERLLAEITERLGHPVPAAWHRALAAVPRHLFLPDRLWLRDGQGGYAPCDRTDTPDRWWHAAYSDIPLVTHFTDDQAPASSASAPSTVIRMLELADLTDSTRVLEIGTGTGFHAALLSARLGERQVVSVEIDPAPMRGAGAALSRAGFHPGLHLTDGALGHPAGAPYDRIIATCSVSTVPPAWPAQTVPGGRIVTPWGAAWCGYGTLTLTRHADGTASGPFTPYGSYMVMRGQRPDVELRRDLLRADQNPDVSATDLSPWSVAGPDLDAQFAIGLRLPGVWHSWDTGTGEAHTRLWLADDAATSWASVDYDGHRSDTFRVAQHGPRRLWDEVANAWDWWNTAGRPGIDRFGLTVTPTGQTPWLNQPEHPLDAPPSPRPHATHPRNRAGGGG